MVKRRAPGEGTLRQRSDGRWEWRITIGYDEHGEQLRKSVYGRTQAEATENRNELLKNHGLVDLDNESLTVRQLVKLWLEHKTSSADELKPRTLQGYRITCDKHILPKLGRLKVRKVTPLHVDHVLDAMSDDEYSVYTVAGVRRIMAGIFRQAVRWRVIASNPVDAVEPPDRRARRRQKREGPPAWTAGEVITFLKTAQEHRLFPLFYLALTTGLRAGELLALRVEDLDLEEKTLRVERSLYYIPEKGLQFGAPKTDRGRRVLELSPDTISVLTGHVARLEDAKEDAAESWRDHGLLFPTTVGTPISPRNLIRSYKAVLKNCAVSEIRFHDLRHTYATLALRKGLPLGDLSHRLGHHDPAFTLSVYTHVLEDAPPKAQSLAELTTVADARTNEEGLANEQLSDDANMVN